MSSSHNNYSNNYPTHPLNQPWNYHSIPSHSVVIPCIKPPLVYHSRTGYATYYAPQHQPLIYFVVSLALIYSLVSNGAYLLPHSFLCFIFIYKYYSYVYWYKVLVVSSNLNKYLQSLDKLTCHLILNVFPVDTAVVISRGDANSYWVNKLQSLFQLTIFIQSSLNIKFQYWALTDFFV